MPIFTAKPYLHVDHADSVEAMGERTKYTHGTFSWADLTTPDPTSAKHFYGELFGWEMIDNPVGGGVVYTTARIGGQDVAAISPQQQQQRDAGAPPAWNSYITVDSADEALERAKELGGTVHAPAFDVMTVGRMGVIQDPQGAYVLVWEPKEHIGASLVNAPGAISWNELASPDQEASAAFYGGVFGWKTTAMEGLPFPYLVINTADDHTNGGIAPITTPGSPPYWLVYFGSNDVEADLAKVSALGGTELVGVTDIGMGKIAVAQDPQGAAFALFSGEFDD
jgi:predicted enzyme related to lactoylglutathione lyase